MKLIKKIVAPTKHCSEPYLTVWIADKDEGTQIWIQTSSDISAPQWERYGNLFEQMWLEDNNELNEDIELCRKSFSFPKRIL